MCLIAKDDTILTAEEDITVIKSLIAFPTGNKYASPYHWFIYKRGETYKLGFDLHIVYRDRGWRVIEYEVYEGFHAYTTKHMSPADNVGKGYYKMIIPKGSHYIISYAGSEIVSDCIHFPLEEVKTEEDEKEKLHT